MTIDPNNVQQPSRDDLVVRLDDTILWLELRRIVPQELLKRLSWAEGTVPRQAEVAELVQRNRRMGALVVSLLERLAARGMPVSTGVALAVTLGIELPTRLLEILE